jgi:hypothetical protein
MVMDIRKMYEEVLMASFYILCHVGLVIAKKSMKIVIVWKNTSGVLTCLWMWLQNKPGVLMSEIQQVGMHGLSLQGTERVAIHMLEQRFWVILRLPNTMARDWCSSFQG